MAFVVVTLSLSEMERPVVRLKISLRRWKERENWKKKSYTGIFNRLLPSVILYNDLWLLPVINFLIGGFHLLWLNFKVTLQNNVQWDNQFLDNILHSDHSICFYSIVSEDGASIYSVSQEAENEMPSLDVNLRSAGLYFTISFFKDISSAR